MDGEQLRRAAVRVAALADEVRSVGSRMAAASGVRWRSASAAAFRVRLGEQAVAVRRAATEVEDVAVALNRHAQAVDAAGLPAGLVAGAVSAGGAVLHGVQPNRPAAAPPGGR